MHNDLKTGKRVRAIDDIWSSTTYVEDLIDRVMMIRRTASTAPITSSTRDLAPTTNLPSKRATARTAREQIDRLIEITHERDMKRVAKRPRYTPLRCLLSEELGLPPMRDWRAALAAYVCELEYWSNGVLESRISRSCPPCYIPILIISNRRRSD